MAIYKNWVIRPEETLRVLRSAHTRVNVAGTYNRIILQRQFPRVTCPFSRKRCVAGTRFCLRNMLHKIQLVWLVRHKAGQNDVTFQCRLVCTAYKLSPPPPTVYFLCLNPLHVHQLANCPQKMHPLYAHEGACLRFHVPARCSLGYADLYFSEAKTHQRLQQTKTATMKFIFLKYAICNSSFCLKVTSG